MQQVFTNITCCKNINMQLAASLKLLSMNVKQFWRTNDAAYTIYINVRGGSRGSPRSSIVAAWQHSALFFLSVCTTLAFI